jgi:hypothetical protein
MAIDIAPHPLDWQNTHAFAFLAGLMFATAALHDVKIRGGIDWDQDMQIMEAGENDLGHFEIVGA